MKKKNWGWVIEILEESVHYRNGEGKLFYSTIVGDYCGPLKNAMVFNSRYEARECLFDDETVRKVSLTKTGKPKKIIGRG